MNNVSNLIENKAIHLLDNYQGANNYILKLKTQKENNPKFYPTRAQSDYIISFINTIPKVGKKWVELDPYFAKKIADEKLFTTIPEKVWVEKLLVEKEKSYHIWVIFLENKITTFGYPKLLWLKLIQQKRLK